VVTNEERLSKRREKELLKVKKQEESTIDDARLRTFTSKQMETYRKIQANQQ
jgi:hypothetical protein